MRRCKVATAASERWLFTKHEAKAKETLSNRLCSQQIACEKCGLIGARFFTSGAGHRNERDGDNTPFRDRPVEPLFDDDEMLPPLRSNRDNQLTAHGELLNQRLGNVIWSGGYNNQVERGVFLPAAITVTVADFNVPVIE